MNHLFQGDILAPLGSSRGLRSVLSISWFLCFDHVFPKLMLSLDIIPFFLWWLYQGILGLIKRWLSVMWLWRFHWWLLEIFTMIIGYLVAMLLDCRWCIGLLRANINALSLDTFKGTFWWVWGFHSTCHIHVCTIQEPCAVGMLNQSIRLHWPIFLVVS